MHNLEKNEKKSSSMHKITRRQRAENDAKEIYDYYEDCREGLGGEFLKELEERIQKILVGFPKIVPIAYKNRRRLTLKKFPHQVVFIINEIKKEVQLLAIIHPKRNLNP